MSLQIYLPFNGDTKNYGLANDVTITTNNITFNQNGKIGQCAVFNGSNSFISLTSTILNNCFKGSNQEVTIAFWIKHNDTNRAIIFGDYGLTGAIGFNLELKASSTSDWRWYWNGSPDQSLGSNVAPADGNWHHCAIVYTGTKLRAYKDGVLAGSELTLTLSSKAKSSGAWYIGRDSRTGATAFNGNLNDFRIYDNALSISEIAWLAGNKKHKELELWMPLNNNLNSYGTKKITATGTAITYANAKTGANATFNGSTSVIDTNFVWVPTTGWTIAGWVQHTSTTPHGPLVRGSTSHSPVIDFNGTNGALRYFYWKTSSTYNIVETTYIPAQNSWHHYVATWDGTKMSCYVDGTLLSSLNCSDTPYNDGGTVQIGKNSVSGALTGRIADVRCYNYGLSASEVYELSLGKIGHIMLNCKQLSTGGQDDYNGFGMYRSRCACSHSITARKQAGSPRYQSCFLANGAYINLGSTFNSGPVDELTFSLWCYAANWGSTWGSATYSSFLSSIEGGGKGAQYIKSSGALQLGDAAIGYAGITSANITAGWHLITVVINGFKSSFYLDGVLQSESSAKSTKTALHSKANYFYIGCESAGTSRYNNGWFTGKISDVEFYVKALTEADIQKIYAKGHVPS